MLSLRARPAAAVINPDLTQAQFAGLLRAAMELRHMGPAALSRETARVSQGKGIHQGTISSRYTRDDYDKGPPDPQNRRLLEEALRVPKFYLEGVGVTIPASGASHAVPPRVAPDTQLLDEARETALSEFKLTDRHGNVPRDRAEFWVSYLYTLARKLLHASAETETPSDHGHARG